MHTLIRLLVLLALGFAGEAAASGPDASAPAARRLAERTAHRVCTPLEAPPLRPEACLETTEEDQEEEESADLAPTSPRPMVFIGSTPADEVAVEPPALAGEWVAAVRGPPRGRGTS